MTDLASHIARLEAERLTPSRDGPDSAELLDQVIETLALGLFGIRRAHNDPGRAIGGRRQCAPRLPDIRLGGWRPRSANLDLHGTRFAG